jgi:heme/copper-type cytochrome/quinol oxidase subunit 3
MHMLQSLFYLTTALHVSDVTITHLQELFVLLKMDDSNA